MSPWWLRTRSDESAHEDDFELIAEAEIAVADDPEAMADDGESEEPEKASRDAKAGRAKAGEKRNASREKESEEKEPEDDDAPSSSRSPRRRRRRRRKSGGGGEPSKDSETSSSSSSPTSAPRAAPPSRPAPVPQPRAEAVPAAAQERQAKEIVYVTPERAFAVQEERKLAMFCDLENIALGVRDSEVKKFDVNLVLERLLEKGKLIVKKAYADWQRYSDYKRPFHEAAIEMIDIPQKYYSGKNSADIKMVVDAMDLCYSKEHLDTFVILSGDSDFSPLVSKLKENDKYVIGIGVKKSSSNLLIANCDEFIYYEDVWRDLQKVPRLDHLSNKDAEVFGLLIDAMLALIRENKEVLWGSMLKQTMKRKRPSFNEGYYGYSTFSELLEDAEKKKIVEIERDQRSGGLVVTGFATRG